MARKERAMSIVVERDVLNAALSMMVGGKSDDKDTTTIGYQYLKFSPGDGVCTITSHANDVTVVDTVEAMCAPGDFCIRTRQLSDLVKALEGVITITPEDDKALVECGRSKQRLPMLRPELIPETPKVNAKPIEFDGKLFQSMIENTMFAMASSEAERPGLQFELLQIQDGEFAVVAGDGHRLAAAVVPFPYKDKFEALIPARAASLFARFAAKRKNVLLTVTENNAMLSDGDTGACIISRVSAERYPNWRMVLPKSPPHLATFDYDELKKAIVRANLTSEEGGGVSTKQYWTLHHGGQLVIVTRDSKKGEGEERVTADIKLEDEKSLTLGVHGRQVLDFMEHAPSARIAVRLTNANSQLLLTSEAILNYVFHYVFMPVSMKRSEDKK
jgi:DNA polymerase III sliding clamp (beta) subunit (PCNA family)